MPEFVAECAEGRTGITYLRYKSIIIYFVVLVATIHDDRIVFVYGECCLVSPDGVLVAAIVLSHAGIDYQYLVYVAIIIPVVGCPVCHCIFQGVGQCLK